jgi:hypothetical protein
MEKDEMITPENEVVKEYQVPELVDLNGINTTQATPPINCTNGTSPTNFCTIGNGVT